jgi:hypothetical protein
MAESYLEEVQLPSRGYFYEGRIPDGVVSISPMGTKEEKLFASGGGRGKILDKIFDACISLPSSITHQELVGGDRLFLLLKLRSVSYGNKYSYPYRCRECKESFRGEVNLDKLELREAKEGSGWTFEALLPLLGKTLTLRFLTGEDENKVEKYKKNLKSHGMTEGDEYIYRLARRVVAVDGEEVGIREAMELVESLRGLDSMAVRDAIDDNDVGPILELDPECPHCGFVNGPVIMPFDTEFFRPRRRRSRDYDPVKAAEAVDASV